MCLRARFLWVKVSKVILIQINRGAFVALVKCGECSKEVSDKAQSCPNCGSPIASLNVTLVMTGLPRRYIGAKAIDVFFNGELKISVEKGSTVTLTLPGAGKLEFSTRYNFRTQKQSFDIPAGATANLEFDFGPMGGLKVLESNSGRGSGSFFGVSMEMPDFED